jgi:NADH-quinone oxidoreductase subunit L
VIGGALNLPGLDTFTTWLGHTLKIEQAVNAIRSGGEAAAGGFNPVVAIISTGLALVAIFLAYVLYYRRYPEFLKTPPARRPADPLRNIIGPAYEGMEHKWWVDELYWKVILNPYIALSRFLADVVDWRFWHDWFHEVVIAGGYRQLSRLLSVRVDLGVIDAIANGLATVTQSSAGRLRRVETGYVRNYALAVFLGVVVIIGYLALR